MIFRLLLKVFIVGNNVKKINLILLQQKIFLLFLFFLKKIEFVICIFGLGLYIFYSFFNLVEIYIYCDYNYNEKNFLGSYDVQLMLEERGKYKYINFKNFIMG